MIIAITGLKRSGKNTLGSYIRDTYGFQEYAFAKPIKEVTSLLFGWTQEYMEEHKEEIDEVWGVSPRQVMQYFGTEDFQYNFPKAFPEFEKRVGRTFWVKKFEQLLQQNGDTNFVITDFRFPHEQEILSKYNAVTIKVINPAIKATDLHESESYIQKMKCDYNIMNDGTKEDLYEKARFLMDTLGKNNGR
mgnify:CR=1 FL=1